MNNHDDHYTKLPIEPIDVMEQRAKTNNKVMNGPDRTQCLHLALSIKYIMRAGWKEGQHWTKDIRKAQNHLHRALTGEWLPAEKVQGDGYTCNG